MSRITVNGRPLWRSTSRPDQRRIAGKLVDEALREREVAVARDDDPLPEQLLNLHGGAVVDEIAVPGS